MIALAGCSGGGSAPPTTATATATASQSAEAKVYSEDELRNLISGMADADGNELKLYSKEQVDQGGKIANLLMSTATVDPQDCKGIATAGLLDAVDNGKVAIAISGSEEPRTLSAQSGSEGPDAMAVLQGISQKMGQCASFSVQVLGRKYQVSSKELQANTDAQKTFATVSTRGQANQDMLMQVSAARGRLLVVATKGGPDLGDQDRKELEDLINKVLHKAGAGTSGPTSTSTTGATGTAPPGTSASPTATGSASMGTASPETSASPSASGSESAGMSSPSPTSSP